METKGIMLMVSISLDNGVFLWSTGHNKNYYNIIHSQAAIKFPIAEERGEVKAGRVFNDDEPLLFF